MNRALLQRVGCAALLASVVVALLTGAGMAIRARICVAVVAMLSE